MRTPPGVAAKDFADAIAAFQAIVGKQWVFTSDEDLEPYRDAYSIVRDEPEERIASAAVAPFTSEEVQAVMRIANDRRIPIYPISTGKNLGYGGAAPVLSGSVVLDLKRMNRILEIDERNAYALVEPGVTYFDLYRAIRDRKLNLWIDCPDPGWGSVIGNALDYGGGYTHSSYRNHFDAHCGMEVVLANGETLRTGMGALPGAPGTAALQAKYHGAVPARLDQRTDLSLDFVIATVRHGISVMPAARKTEIGDIDLKAIATYLTRKR